jgi:hypothetical protein
LAGSHQRRLRAGLFFRRHYLANRTFERES